MHLSPKSPVGVIHDWYPMNKSYFNGVQKLQLEKSHIQIPMMLDFILVFKAAFFNVLDYYLKNASYFLLVQDTTHEQITRLILPLYQKSIAVRLDTHTLTLQQERTYILLLIFES